MRLQDYLSPNENRIHEAKFIFYLRTRMVDVKTNYRGRISTLHCTLCKKWNQEHLLTCTKLDEGNYILTAIPDYSDLFGENLDRKITLERIINARFKKRKALIKKKIAYWPKWSGELTLWSAVNNVYFTKFGNKK